jgi:hypothetical protein
MNLWSYWKSRWGIVGALVFCLGPLLPHVAAQSNDPYATTEASGDLPSDPSDPNLPSEPVYPNLPSEPTVPATPDGFPEFPVDDSNESVELSVPGGLSYELPTAPSGFSDGPTGLAPWSGLGSNLLDGLSVDTTFSSTYNSNMSGNQSVANGEAKDDYILGFGGNLNYLSKRSALTFGGNYRGNYNQYFNHSDYTGYSQGAGLVANYKGGRFTIAATAGMELQRGNNSNYSSSFVEQTSIRSGVTVNYKLSAKTSLRGNFNQNFTSTAGRSYSDTSSYDFGLSAMWKYSALTEFGPGVRYAYRTGGSSQSGRTSIGPTLSLNYKLSSKVALNSRIGMDFSSYDSGATADPTFSASIGLNYRASDLWGMNLTLYRDTQADTALAGGFTQLNSLQVGYHRQLSRAMWNLSASYQLNSYERPGAATPPPDQSNFNLNTSLSMPIFSNTCSASVFVGYREQNSGNASRSWDSVQTGFSISRKF